MVNRKINGGVTEEGGVFGTGDGTILGDDAVGIGRQSYKILPCQVEHRRRRWEILLYSWVVVVGADILTGITSIKAGTKLAG